MNSFLTLFDLIGVLAHRRYQTVERRLSPFGFNHTEARLLSLLAQEDGVVTQDELSDMLFVDRSNAGRALKRLERDDYIVRRRDDADKRAHLVAITEKGREASQTISGVKEEITQSFFRDLTKKEADAAVKILKKALSEEEYAMRANVPGTNRRRR